MRKPTTKTALTTTQETALVACMARRALADYAEEGYFHATGLAEYALAAFGDALHLDDGELAPIWELAIRASQRADQLIAAQLSR